MIEIILLITLGYAIGWVMGHPEEAKAIWDVIIGNKPESN